MKTIEIKTTPEICFANNFAEAHYSNEFRPHYTHIELIKITEGTISVTVNGKTTVAGEGDIIFNFYEKDMKLLSTSFHSHISVCARVKWRECEGGKTIPYIIQKTHGEKISQMISNIISQRELGSKLFSDILSEADHIATEYYLSPQERYTKKARAYIEEHIKEPITQRQIASALGITPEYLCAVFKKTEKTTLMQYINRKKLSGVAKDMQNEGIKLYEASARYGYADPHYVSRLYKKLFSKRISAAIEKNADKVAPDNIFRFNKEALPKPVYEERLDLVALYYKAFELMFDNIDYINKENWKPVVACMPGVSTTWQWDSCIMTFFTNYLADSFSALNNLDNLYRLQRDDGYISMAYKIETEKEAFDERINPPLYAWAEWEHYLISGDSSRFEYVTPKIEALYDFIEKNRRHQNGLYFFEDVNSSGMNDSPRGSNYTHNSGLAFIDLASQQSLTALCLSKMYSVLENSQKSDYFKSENNRINELINKYHYCEKTGFYHDLFINTRKTLYLSNKTAASFWVMLCGAVQGDRRLRMAKHIMSPDEFYTNTPFATLSKDDPNFDSNGGSWLGASRPQTTFAAIRGLYECGFTEFATQSAKKYLDVLSAVANDSRYGSIWECYSPDSPQPALKDCGHLAMSNFVGCAGVGPITVFIENVIGLHFDAHKNSVIFDITTDKKCGIENMVFGGAKLSVIFENGKVFINTQKEFTITIKKDGNVKKCDVTAGKTYIEV